jgi:Protein of unknown function (DUF2510)
MTQFPPNQPPSGGWPPTPTAAGWHPDPTGRHQHRYWDGVHWTDHVADNGVESVDQFSGGSPQGMPSGGYAQGGGPYASGAPPMPTGPRPRSGPSPALLALLGLLLVGVIVGVVVVLSQGDDDDDGESSGSTTTTQADGSSTTAGDTTESTDSGDAGGSGDSDLIVEALAAGMLQSSGGALTEDQANCIAERMYDSLGADRIVELGQDPNGPLAGLTSEEQTAITTALLECVDAETLGELDPNSGGG